MLVNVNKFEFLYLFFFYIIAEFSLKVYNKVASDVTFGNRISYSELADLIKCPNASRAVGTALKKNPFTIIIPCHRVIPKSGGIGFYGGGKECAPLKEWLLNYEDCVSKKYLKLIF